MRRENHEAPLMQPASLMSLPPLEAQVPYFPAHKTHREFFVRNFRKK